MPNAKSHTHLQATQISAPPKLTNKYAFFRHAPTDRKALAITAPKTNAGRRSFTRKTFSGK